MRRASRRRFLHLAGALLTAPRAFSQPPRRRARIGYLLLGPVTDPPSRERQAFLAGLMALGYEPGRNVELIYKSAEGEVDFMDAVAQDLVRHNPDLIAVSGTAAVLAAKRATRTIPVVILAQGDPVGVGAVSSLSKPGGNLTGVSFLSSELASKRLQLAMECVPGAKRVAIIWDRRNVNSREEARAVQAAADRLGLAVESTGQDSDADLARTLQRLATEKPHLIYVTFDDGLAGANRSAIAGFGIRLRIPVVSGWHFLTEAGGLMSYAPDIPAMFHRGAHYVDRILKGAKPGDLPIERPTKVDLVLNWRTAGLLGLRFPQDMLLRAERVIE